MGDDTRLPVGIRAVTITPETIELATKTAHARSIPLNRARGVFLELLLREAQTQLRARDVSIEGIDRGLAELRTSEAFRKLVDKCWPTLSGPALVRTLLGNRRARGAATADVLDGEEADALHRTPTPKLTDEPWTAADLALIDEATALCGGATRQYGHVVVDEAQDLSTMALRAAGRRARAGSMTVLGDMAQATTPQAQPSWSRLEEALGVDTASSVELTVGYRVPGPILEFANHLLPISAPDVTPAVSIRQRGSAPTIVEVGPREIVAATVAAARGYSDEWTSVGVVAPHGLLDPLADALTAATVDFSDCRTTRNLDRPVSLLAPLTAKGLEFDAVIVVEPSEFELLANGLRLLYVALTRAVQRLTVIHSQPLPAALV